MTIQIKAIDHVVFATADSERMEQFYCEVLGCSVERTVPSVSLVQLRAGDCLIDLIAVDAKADANGVTNVDHVCLTVADWDEQGVRAHLTQHGVKFGDTEQRYGAQGSGPSIYLFDPDGNQIELKGPPV